MILCVAIEGALRSTHWDAIVERIHRCTPLIVVTGHGTLYAGTDDLNAIRTLVRLANLHAALAPDRTSALLCALHGKVGRLDAFANADDVPVSVLLRVPELAIGELETERLRLFGISTISHLRTLEERHLRVQFGAMGTRLYTFLTTPHIPLQLYVPPPAIIAHERFDELQYEPGIIAAALESCVQLAIMELGPRQCWRIELSVLDRADEPCTQRSRILRDGVNTRGSILIHAHALLQEMLSSSQRWWGIELRLASLTPPRAVQTQLFVEKKSEQDVSRALISRYATVMKRVEINDPWSIIPEHYARITGYVTDRPGNV